ncbi:heparan-alpha-glucosaminide N-acetyltransferase [Aureococcus anophagefferens]|nr:heparan-alpha-glucosaminide N-acetyltransferase [Aureococcus anophagefferens]
MIRRRRRVRLAVLDHSPWDGLTIADVVMPFFIFMVGVSAALALGGGKRTLAPVLRRGATLLGRRRRPGRRPAGPDDLRLGLRPARSAGRGGGLATADDGVFFGALALLVAAYLAMTYLTPVPTYRVGGAAGFYDREIFGRAHLYADGAYARLPACSSCAPAKCPKACAPAWCAAPGVADPEGFLSGVAVATRL